MNNEEKDYFVHESSYVDEGTKIGKKPESGIFLIFPREQKSVRAVILARMSL